MTTQHTKGPWYMNEHISGWSSVIAPNGYAVCDLTDCDNDKDNARLIAAAPELLEALEMVRDADNDCHLDGLPTIPSIARAKIDAAIAKARGD